MNKMNFEIIFIIIFNNIGIIEVNSQVREVCKKFKNFVEKYIDSCTFNCQDIFLHVKKNNVCYSKMMMMKYPDRNLLIKYMYEIHPLDRSYEAINYLYEIDNKYDNITIEFIDVLAQYQDYDNIYRCNLQNMDIFLVKYLLEKYIEFVYEFDDDNVMRLLFYSTKYCFSGKSNASHISQSIYENIYGKNCEKIKNGYISIFFVCEMYKILDTQRSNYSERKLKAIFCKEDFYELDNERLDFYRNLFVDMYNKRSGDIYKFNEIFYRYVNNIADIDYIYSRYKIDQYVHSLMFKSACESNRSIIVEHILTFDIEIKNDIWLECLNNACIKINEEIVNMLAFKKIQKYNYYVGLVNMMITGHNEYNEFAIDISKDIIKTLANAYCSNKNINYNSLAESEFKKYIPH
jgi:hypothetical protein